MRQGVDDKECSDAEECAKGNLVFGHNSPAQRVDLAEAPAMAANRQIALPTKCVQAGDEQHADDRAEKSTEQDGQETACDPQEGTHHSHHFDVAHAHAFAFAEEFVESGGGPEEECAESSAKEGIEQAEGSVDVGYKVRVGFVHVFENA